MPSSPSPPPPDPWTTDQESALLKAIVTFKPIGLHAHFRMLAIHHSLLQSGTTDPDVPHTRIPGIWAKLRQLYDLERLDEREDVVLTGSDEGTYWRDFELDDGGGSGGGFGEMMWERRLKPGGSDGESEEGDGDERDVTAGETTATDEPRSSPVPSTVGRGTRSGRKGRVSRLKDEMEVDSSPSGRGSRRASKAASEIDDDQNVEDAEDEEGSEDEEIEDSDDEEQQESEKRGSIVRRGRGGRRGRGKRGRRRG